MSRDKLKELFKLFKILKELKDLEDEVYGHRKKRSCAVRSINLDRKQNGYYCTTFLKMKDMDAPQFFIHTRMKKEVFSALFILVEPFLKKNSLREPIAPECRLALTLLYLSQGNSIQSLAWSFKMGKETVRTVILETCDIIWRILSAVYVKQPKVDEYNKISKDFYNICNMPNCIGAIDGKHIAIRCPPNSNSAYYNYKKHFSIVLMAVADAKYTFTHVDVGAYGSQSDGGIFQYSSFGKKLLQNELPIPGPQILPGSDKAIPHYLVGDAAFPLCGNLMRPYPGKGLSKEKEIFNKRLSSARRVIENSFGILVARWRVLLTTLHLIPENAEKVVLACIALHNYLQINKESRKSYCPENYIDWEDENHLVHEGLWRAEVGDISDLSTTQSTHRFGGRKPLEMRNLLCDYFNNEGALPWNN